MSSFPPPSSDSPGSTRVVLETSGSVQRFFEGLVTEAARARSVEATEAANIYLVALLADFARPDPLASEALERPMTLLLDEALHAPRAERFERLRSLGDAVLYTSGFFGEHLQNRGVEPTYVNALGARAYDHASEMLRSHTGADRAPDLFAELAQKFSALVLVVRDVADDVRARGVATNQSLVRTYERWLATGSARLAEALATHGVVPMRATGTLH